MCLRDLPLVLAFTVSLTGCTLLVDDRIGGLEVAPPDPNARVDLSVGLRVFSPHVGQDVFLDAINPNGVIVAQALIANAPSDCLDVNLASAIPADTEVVDFWADLNRDGELSPPPQDHSWSEMLVDGELLFVHNTDFADLTDEDFERTAAGFPLRFELFDVETFVGQPVDVVYVNVTTDTDGNPVEQEIGLAHVSSIPESPVIVELSSVVDAGTEYIIEVSLGEGDTRTRCVTNQRRADVTDALVVPVSINDPDLGCTEVPVEETRQAFEDCSLRP